MHHKELYKPLIACVYSQLKHTRIYLDDIRLQHYDRKSNYFVIYETMR